MRLMRPSPVTDIRPSASPSFVVKLFDRLKRMEYSVVVWWCLALSILCSSITRFSAESSGVLYYAAAILGSGGCAWFWLLSRSLFRSRKELYSGIFYVVPVVIVIEAIAALMSPSGAVGLANEAGRVFVNAASMVCIASIVFVYNEALHGFNKLRSAAERRFRVVFIGGFSLLVGIAILWVSGASSGTVAAEWNVVLLTVCAVLGGLGSRIAVQYRLLNPQGKSARCEVDKEALELLAQRILKEVRSDDLLTIPNLKVLEFADRIEEQEYKVTRCITNHLQYRNFNHLLNSHRIDRAKRIFNDSNSRHLTIATIAYDCGFNSLGPFNRAFRQYTGVTPREFRQQ